MYRFVERGWRPLIGALAIGFAAFGLSLQGAPAGDRTDLLVDRGAELAGAAAALGSRSATTENIPEFQRQRKMVSIPGPNQQGADPTSVEMVSEDTVLHVGRVIGANLVATKGHTAATSRAAGSTPIGDECSCDEDCNAADGDDCNLVQCIVRSTCTGDGQSPCSTNGDCEGNGTCDTSLGAFVQRCDTIQLIDWPCDLDADFCTADRCEDDLSGQSHSICAAQNDTSDGSGGSLSACAKQCAGGPAAGLSCARASDCAQGLA